MEEEKRQKLVYLYIRFFVIISSIILLIIYTLPLLKLIYDIFKLSLHSFLGIFLFIFEIKIVINDYKIIVGSCYKIKVNAEETFESIKKKIKENKIKALIEYLVKFFITIFFIYFIYYLWKYLALKLIMIIINIIEIILFILYLYETYTNNKKQIIEFFPDLWQSLIIFLIDKKIFSQCNKKKLIYYCSFCSLVIILTPFIFKYIIAYLYYILKKIINFGLLILVNLAVLLYYLINFEEINNTIMRYLKMINKILKEELDELFDSSLIKAKKLVLSFLSEEKSHKYKQFAQVINNFKKVDFYKLLNGEINIDNNEYEIDFLCYKYKIEDKESFKLLILKFLNFQLILSEWIENKTKHEYLKGLWKIYPTMHQLNNLSEEDLENKLRVINYSEWSEEDKNIFKQCISNSPEIKAIELTKFIQNEDKEFNILFENMMNYNSSLKNYQKMENYGNKLYNYTKQFLKIFLENKGKITDSVDKIKDIINNRTIECILKNYIPQKVCQSYEFYFSKLINSIKNVKVINILKSSNQFLSAPFSFLELSYHVVGLIKCFNKLYYPESDIFNYELEQINKNFQKHKENITNITGNDKEDLKLIKTILLDIKNDRDDIIKLISKMNDKKECAELKKKKHIIDLVKYSASTFFGVTLGTILSGGIAPAIGGIAIATGIVQTVKSGLKIVIDKNIIDSFNKLLIEAEEKQKEIEEEIKNIEKIYCMNITEHCPDEIRQKIIGKYCK